MVVTEELSWSSLLMCSRMRFLRPLLSCQPFACSTGFKDSVENDPAFATALSEELTSALVLTATPETVRAFTVPVEADCTVTPRCHTLLFLISHNLVALARESAAIARACACSCECHRD
jgi:hypothetical protein